MTAAQFDAVTRNVAALTREQVIAAAKAQNAKVMNTEPRPAAFTRHVDGIEGAAEEAVRPGGEIVYDYDRIDLVAEFALDTLRQLSPVYRGNYVRGHTLFVGGQPVDDIRRIGAAKTVVIANTEPYARKIEVGGKQFRTHPHVYERAESIVARRFGNIADVRFGYFAVTIGDIEDWAASTVSGRRGGSKAAVDHWLRRQPALYISRL